MTTSQQRPARRPEWPRQLRLPGQARVVPRQRVVGGQRSPPVPGGLVDLGQSQERARRVRTARRHGLLQAFAGGGSCAGALERLGEVHVDLAALVRIVRGQALVGFAGRRPLASRRRLLGHPREQHRRGRIGGEVVGQTHGERTGARTGPATFRGRAEQQAVKQAAPSRIDGRRFVRERDGRVR